MERGSPDAGLSPRVRGNRGKTIDEYIPPSDGLSPRVRGNHPDDPTRAGQLQVYPRACGGTGDRGFYQGIPVGLSPRVRGNHPDDATAAVDKDGLSPRVRGNPRLPDSAMTLDRLGSIPARAGEPQESKEVDPLFKVYPRACGGTSGLTDEQSTGLGLSPRVRGNQCQPAGPAVYPRACGGTSSEPSRCWLVLVAGLSPRVRGNQFRLAMRRPMARGLSPRVRGNPERPSRPEHSRRSIPARAGEP